MRERKKRNKKRNKNKSNPIAPPRNQERCQGSRMSMSMPMMPSSPSSGYFRTPETDISRSKSASNLRRESRIYAFPPSKARADHSWSVGPCVSVVEDCPKRVDNCQSWFPARPLIWKFLSLWKCLWTRAASFPTRAASFPTRMWRQAGRRRCQFPRWTSRFPQRRRRYHRLHLPQSPKVVEWVEVHRHRGRWQRRCLSAAAWSTMTPEDLRNDIRRL